jgi:hypothetical protein
MDKAILVDRDLRMGRDVIGLLAAADLAVDDAFWAYVPQAEEWRLVLSSPIVKKLGVRNCYLKMSNALRKSPLWQEIPLRRISLFAPDDDVIERLNALEKYRYEGAVEIIKTNRKNGSPTFLVFFVPYKGPGGEAPTVSLNGESELEEFLRDQLGISEPSVATALRDLDTRGSYSFENLELTTAKLRKIGLLHPLHPQRVYRRQ